MSIGPKSEISRSPSRVSEPNFVFDPGWVEFRSRQDAERCALLHGTFIISRQGKMVWNNRGDEPFVETGTLLHEIARVEGRLQGNR